MKKKIEKIYKIQEIRDLFDLVTLAEAYKRYIIEIKYSPMGKGLPKNAGFELDDNLKTLEYYDAMGLTEEERKFMEVSNDEKIRNYIYEMDKKGISVYDLFNRFI